MDLSKLAPAKEPYFVHLKHPVKGTVLMTEETNEPIGIFVVGTDSDEYAECERNLLDQGLALAQARAQNQATVKPNIAERAIDTIAACVKSWKNITLDGNSLQCTPENVRLLITRFRWIREQLDREIGNRANFIKG